MLNTPPPGYVKHNLGDLRVVALEADADLIISLLERETSAGREIGEAGETGVDGGRGATRRIEIGAESGAFLCQYLRGGFVRYLTKDLYFGSPKRPARELAVTELARRAGCNVPLVLGTAARLVRPWYRGWILTRAIEPARSLIDVYASAAPAARAELIDRVAREVASLHGAGIYHVDLTGHNVLIDDDGTPHIIDFDRAALAAPGDRGLIRRGVGRFERSMTKLCERHGIAAPRDIPARFAGA